LDQVGRHLRVYVAAPRRRGSAGASPPAMPKTMQSSPSKSRASASSCGRSTGSKTVKKDKANDKKKPSELLYTKGKDLSPTQLKRMENKLCKACTQNTGDIDRHTKKLLRWHKFKVRKSTGQLQRSGDECYLCFDYRRRFFSKTHLLN
jgi:hypothetical protein